MARPARIPAAAVVAMLLLPPGLPPAATWLAGTPVVSAVAAAQSRLDHNQATPADVPAAAADRKAEENRRIVIGSVVGLLIFAGICLLAWWRGPHEDREAKKPPQRWT